MRFLIFSDVHSNLEALRAFEALAEGIPHDKKACLGDLVGYCADPNPCLNWIREHVDIVLAGNHDYAALGKTDLAYFNPYALESCHWTRKALTKKSAKFLSTLTAEQVAGGVHWTHASPHEPEEWHYILSRVDGRDNFDQMQEAVCFFGHTHQPLVLEETPDGGISRKATAISSTWAASASRAMATPGRPASSTTRSCRKWSFTVSSTIFPAPRKKSARRACPATSPTASARGCENFFHYIRRDGWLGRENIFPPAARRKPVKNRRLASPHGLTRF